MTPKESAKLLRDVAEADDLNLTLDLQDAMKLGASALEAFLFARSGGSWDPRALLPGEAPYKSIYAPGCNPSLRGLGALKIE
ncbi:hypothetical protein ES708_14988 [subsurface metagenome]